MDSLIRRIKGNKKIDQIRRSVVAGKRCKPIKIARPAPIDSSGESSIHPIYKYYLSFLLTCYCLPFTLPFLLFAAHLCRLTGLIQSSSLVSPKMLTFTLHTFSFHSFAFSSPQLNDFENPLSTFSTYAAPVEMADLLHLGSSDGNAQIF